ncbi:hypothetical protein TNCV_4347271 [Trichonephila clavipes]|nr:hypothetical protein TNCV_4347271 [Trichonephila clavipes]
MASGTIASIDYLIPHKVIGYGTNKFAECVRSTEMTRNHIGMQGHKYRCCKNGTGTGVFHIPRPCKCEPKITSSGHTKSSVYETSVPSVEDLIVRIPGTNGRIHDIPGIFEIVRNYVQQPFQVFWMPCGCNFEHL